MTLQSRGCSVTPMNTTENPTTIPMTLISLPVVRDRVALTLEVWTTPSGFQAVESGPGGRGVLGSFTVAAEAIALVLESAGWLHAVADTQMGREAARWAEEVAHARASQEAALR